MLNVLLLPIAANKYLRRTYEQTLAHWESKIVRPDRVFIGDSITAGGGSFGLFGTINLASNGLHTAQVAALLKTAESYNPHHIFVMAGTNDVFDDTDQRQRLEPAWRTLLEDKRILVTLIPPNRGQAFNLRRAKINAMIATYAARAGRPVVSLQRLAGPDGRIQSRYTYDGTHFTPAAYAVWRAELERTLVASGAASGQRLAP